MAINLSIIHLLYRSCDEFNNFICSSWQRKSSYRQMFALQFLKLLKFFHIDLLKLLQRQKFFGSPKLEPLIANVPCILHAFLLVHQKLPLYIDRIIDSYFITRLLTESSDIHIFLFECANFCILSIWLYFKLSLLYFLREKIFWIFKHTNTNFKKNFAQKFE